jgi:hypothetical protein
MELVSVFTVHVIVSFRGADIGVTAQFVTGTGFRLMERSG